MKKFLFLFFIVLTACSSSADTETALQAARDFHDKLDAGQFQTIYDQSSDELKKISTQQEFVTFLEAVHRKLGKTKSFERKSKSFFVSTSGTTITLEYDTVYEQGNAQENFVYLMKGDAAMLYGYHINSMALITK